MRRKHLDALLWRLLIQRIRVICPITYESLRLAQTYDLIEQSPVRPKLHRPTVPKVEKPTLSADEIGGVLLQLDDRERLFLRLIVL